MSHASLFYRILRLGLAENLAYRMSGKIHVDGLLDNLSKYASNIERLELGWDPETLRYSDKSQKCIDTLRVRCLKLKSLILWLVSTFCYTLANLLIIILS